MCTLSVVICTHNRATYLSNCLSGLGRQESVAHDWEILVVDNASTDETVKVYQAFASRNCGKARYVYEPRLGLSVARNRGVRESEGAIVAFLDDDGEPAPHWVSSIMDSMSREPSAGGVGGPVLGRWGVPRPPWLPPEIAYSLEFRDTILGSSARALTVDEVLPGGNSAFRRRVLDEVGAYDESLGRVGRRMLGFEDFDLVWRLHSVGITLLYNPDMAIQHPACREALTKRSLYERALLTGYSRAVAEIRRLGRTGTAWKAIGHGVRSISRFARKLWAVLTGSEARVVFWDYSLRFGLGYISGWLRG